AEGSDKPVAEGSDKPVQEVPVDSSTMRTRGTNTKQSDPRTASPKKNSDTELKNKFGKSDNRGSLKDKEK
ncbi:MAG: hypothetical protein Q4A24_09240, partial [Akkermansia sp.]|nr:hypothetical protein [Akkermansia sp.]